MGRFSNKVSATARETRNTIKINLYELPEYALQAIANICQKNNTDDASFIIGSLRSELLKNNSNRKNFYDIVEEYRRELFDFDFLQKIRECLDDLITELLAHENTSDTQVAVAGGFSAGKSSFLNALTKSTGLLPTGIDPVSMVSTYLYCDKHAKDITVRGINLKNAVVRLDKDILQSIQHESKSKIYLASVLNKLFVEIPSQDLDGFVFIDTPGYNNSEKKNEANNSTDEETALSAIDKGNVLLWVVDAGAGTVPKRDLEIIRFYLEQDENRKVVIVFNKADKKGEREIKRIVDSAYSELSSFGDSLIDVLGYSSHEDKVYYSAHGYDMSALLKQLRLCGNGNSGVERIIGEITGLFDDEIDFAHNVVDEFKKERKALIDKKNQAYKDYSSEKKGTKHYVESISEIMIDSYDELLGSLDRIQDVCVSGLNEWFESLDEINNTNESNFQTKDNIRALIEKYDKSRIKIVSKFEKARDYEYFLNDYRQEWLDLVETQLNRVDENLQENYEYIERELEIKNQEIEKFTKLADLMINYRDIVLNTLRTCIKYFKMSAHKVQDARVSILESHDVFSAIRAGDYSKFTLCFGNGVKMTEFNSEGYSPLTYAVKYGANDMVKFFVDQKADLRALDGRGYDAFLTAVENGFKDIVTILLEHDRTLCDTRSAKGESVMDIASKQSFTDYLRNVIK